MTAPGVSVLDAGDSEVSSFLNGMGCYQKGDVARVVPRLTPGTKDARVAQAIRILGGIEPEPDYAPQVQQDAHPAPRASPRPSPPVQASPALLAAPGAVMARVDSAIPRPSPQQAERASRLKWETAVLPSRLTPPSAISTPLPPTIPLADDGGMVGWLARVWSAWRNPIDRDAREAVDLLLSDRVDLHGRMRSYLAAVDSAIARPSAIARARALHQAIRLEPGIAAALTDLLPEPRRRTRTART